MVTLSTISVRRYRPKYKIVFEDANMTARAYTDCREMANTIASAFERAANAGEAPPVAELAAMIVEQNSKA